MLRFPVWRKSYYHPLSCHFHSLTEHLLLILMPAKMVLVPSWHMKDTSNSLHMLAGCWWKLKSNIVPLDGRCWQWCGRSNAFVRTFGDSSLLFEPWHNSLRWLQNFKDPQGQIARWLDVLAEYDFTILHWPGLKHSNADALSRLPSKHCSRHDPDTTAAHSDMVEWRHRQCYNGIAEQFRHRSTVLRPKAGRAVRSWFTASYHMDCRQHHSW